MVQSGGRKKRSGKKRKASAKFLAAGSAWRAHVQETMRKNPNMKFGKELFAQRDWKIAILYHNHQYVGSHSDQDLI